MRKRAIVFGLGVGLVHGSAEAQTRATMRVGFRILPMTTIEKTRAAQPITLLSADASPKRARTNSGRSGSRLAGGVSTIYLGPWRPTQ